MTETSRIEYHETAIRLAKANEHLTDLQHKTEKKTIDIIAVLREKDVETEEKVFLNALGGVTRFYAVFFKVVFLDCSIGTENSDWENKIFSRER